MAKELPEENDDAPTFEVTIVDQARVIKEFDPAMKFILYVPAAVVNVYTISASQVIGSSQFR